MRNIAKLALTLALVALVSALVLSGINTWTSPIIEDNIKKQHLEILKRFFPEADTYVEVELNGIVYDLVYGSGGSLTGVMARVGVQGYDGIITYYLPVSSEGFILGLHIVSHTETPGVGDVIAKPSFQDQFKGKHYRDPLTAGEDVDAVSGATISTMVMIGSIRRTVLAVAENFLGAEDNVIDISLIPDGTYRGTAAGLKPGIVVEVTVENGIITGVHVISHSDTPDYFTSVEKEMPRRIMDQQSTRVDTVTGATASSEGIIRAVEDALLSALDEKGGGE